MTSSINQLRMNMLDMQNFQSSKINKSAIENLIDEKQNQTAVTENSTQCLPNNDAISYDEYIQYCEENAVSQYDSNPSFTFVSTVQNANGQSVRPVHIGKALASYLHFGEEIAKPYVETEV